MAFTRRHAASPSLDARTSRPWDGRPSRKHSWFTFLAFVFLLALKSRPILMLTLTVHSQGTQLPLEVADLFT
jgi:hypothetical protein